MGILTKFCLNLLFALYVNFVGEHYGTLDGCIAGVMVFLTDFFVLTVANFGLGRACDFQGVHGEELMVFGFVIMLVLYFMVFEIMYFISANKFEFRQFRVVAKRSANIALNYASLLGAVDYILRNQSDKMRITACKPGFVWAAGHQFDTTWSLTFLLILYVNTVLWETFRLYLVACQNWDVEPNSPNGNKSVWWGFFLIDLAQIALDVALLAEMQDGEVAYLRVFQAFKLGQSILEMLLDDETWEAFGLGSEKEKNP